MIPAECAHPATGIACGPVIRIIRSDPRLLEQIVRNLISNALKYTKRGRILIGCRQRQGKLSIEVWDTGIGIPQEQLQAIFQEYHQINNDARERNRGLGLGLAIVQRLGSLLGHSIGVGPVWTMARSSLSRLP